MTITDVPIYELMNKADALLAEAELEYRQFEVDRLSSKTIYPSTPFPYIRAQWLTAQAHALTALASVRMTGRGRA